jgi:hypothetical protein
MRDYQQRTEVSNLPIHDGFLSDRRLNSNDVVESPNQATPQTTGGIDRLDLLSFHM